MGKDAIIRVHYPLGRGRIVLRSDADWDADIRPASVGGNDTRFDFRLPLDRPYGYFKPVIRDGREVHWAQGSNYLAVAARRGAQNVYPYFFADPGCSECSVRTIPSRHSPPGHEVRVFYPPGYAENTLESFPVLYMHDGQNLFFASDAFGGHHWRIKETLRILDAMSLVRRALVVGIYPRDRQEEYTLPGYERYGRFIVEELKPWVDGTYRTRRAAADTAVMGSSLGGVVSLYMAWQWPAVFGKAACMSSTFGWKDDLLERVSREERRPIRIYLDSGWPGDNYEATRFMRSALMTRGYQDGNDLLYFAFPEARHNEVDWATRFHVPFQFFFGDTRLETIPDLASGRSQPRPRSSAHRPALGRSPAAPLS